MVEGGWAPQAERSGTWVWDKASYIQGTTRNRVGTESAGGGQGRDSSTAHCPPGQNLSAAGGVKAAPAWGPPAALGLDYEKGKHERPWDVDPLPQPEWPLACPQPSAWLVGTLPPCWPGSLSFSGLITLFWPSLETPSFKHYPNADDPPTTT